MFLKRNSKMYHKNSDKDETFQFGAKSKQGPKQN